MNDYIIESMARVGCGASDTREIISICNDLSRIQWDTLDALNSFGINTSLTYDGQEARKALREEYDDDTIQCLMAYVGAYRNVVSKYPAKVTA